MIRSIYFQQGQARTDLGIDDLPQILKNAEGVLWVDFEETPSEADEPSSGPTLGICGAQIRASC